MLYPLSYEGGTPSRIPARAYLPVVGSAAASLRSPAEPSSTGRFGCAASRSTASPVHSRSTTSRSATSIALAARIDVKVVQEFLGHANSSLTRGIYQTAGEDPQREAAEAIMATMRTV
jgi:integrase